MFEEEDKDIQFWENRWDKGETKWHKDEVNDQLIEHFDKCLKGISKHADEPWDVLVPLCGKSLDIEWLLDKGCRVVGVEVVEKACKILFDQHQWSYNSLTLDFCNHEFLYTSTSMPLKVYKCDIFNFAKYNDDKFDIIWDRGSLVAIDPSKRTQYRDLMKGLHKTPSSHLIETYEYQNENFKGPPHHIDFGGLKQLFGPNYKYEQLKEIDYSENAKIYFDPDFKKCDKNIYLIRSY